MGRERLHVMLSRDLRRDRRTTLDRLHHFLGVDPWTSPSIETEFKRADDPQPVQRRWVRPIGRSRIAVAAGEVMPGAIKKMVHTITRRTPSPTPADLSREVAGQLIDDLRDDITALEDFLGEDLSSWRTWPSTDADG